MASLGVGFAIACCIAYAWMAGRDTARRECRRIVRHGRNLDLVYFEDAEGDPTIERPKPASAAVSSLHLQQSEK